MSTDAFAAPDNRILKEDAIRRHIHTVELSTEVEEAILAGVLAASDYFPPQGAADGKHLREAVLSIFEAMAPWFVKEGPYYTKDEQRSLQTFFVAQTDRRRVALVTNSTDALKSIATHVTDAAIDMWPDAS